MSKVYKRVRDSITGRFAKMSEAEARPDTTVLDVFPGREYDQQTDVLIRKLRAIGPERVTLAAQLVKLRDEVDEVQEGAERGDAPTDILAELADVVVVAHTAARVIGYSHYDLMDAVLAKMYVNAGRDWFPTASGTARHTPEDPVSGTCNCDLGRGYAPDDPGVREAASRGCPVHG